MADTTKQVRSKKRVRELAEVLTAEREVKDMLSLVDEFTEKHRPDKLKLSYSIESTFLEPACGNGNFLVEILERKLSTVRKNYDDRRAGKVPLNVNKLKASYETFQAIASIYGIDIDELNINESIERLFKIIEKHADKIELSSEDKNIYYAILKNNILLGDSLNGKDKIIICEYSYPKEYFISTSYWTLEEIEAKTSGKKIIKSKGRMFRYNAYIEKEKNDITRIR